jgi:peptidyl-prolyl cis-trans isomerase B (cyclophilin B)
VASKSNRQRQLERARAERRLARKAEQQRRRRQLQAAIGGAVALIVIAVGTTWLLGGFSSKPEPVTLPSCTWTAKDATAAGITDTGLPPTSGEPREGAEQLTIKTDQGDITAQLDLGKIPCTAASLSFLGGKGYYDGVSCNRLDTEAKTLTCGDPKGDGTGSPSYQFPDEDLPTAPVGTAAAAPSASAGASASPSASASPVPSYYSRGTIVMANTGPNANGGQFFIIYGDGSNLKNEYSIVGGITSGMEIVDAVAAAGASNAGSAAIAGTPNKTLTIKQLFVGPVPSVNVLPSGTPQPSTSPSTSASPSTSPSAS